MGFSLQIVPNTSSSLDQQTILLKDKNNYMIPAVQNQIMDDLIADTKKAFQLKESKKVNIKKIVNELAALKQSR